MNKPYRKFLYANLFIIAVTYISFYPSFSNGWTTWDDTIYVTDNPVITKLSYENVKTVFTTVIEGSYAPLTFISYMIDYAMGEFDPHVYHRTNLLFHLINSSLVFWLAYQLSGDMMAALVVGVLFGIHPMRVESVAWISGRKDVLAMFFFLLSSISYLFYLKNTKSVLLISSFIIFIFALLSKIIVLTFPIILLLYDLTKKREYSYRVIMEKIPFAIAGGIFALVGYFGQISIQTVEKTPNVLENIIISLHGVVFYLEKYLTPINLSNLYPYSGTVTFKFYLYALLFFVFCFLVWRYRKNETVIFSSLFFFISLLPVLQFIRFSQIFAADRFTYFAYIGLFYGTGVYISSIVKKWNTKIVYSILTVIIITLSCLTWERCRVWKDTNTLWKDMLSKYPDPMSENSIHDIQEYYFLSSQSNNPAIKVRGWGGHPGINKSTG